jgi:hypothetical protein
MDFLAALVLNVALGAVAFVVLFYVVRAAVLSALRAHHEEVNRPPALLTHLDADGL